MRTIKKLSFGCTVLLLGVFIAAICSAEVIGLANPRTDWAGNGALVQWYDINWVRTEMAVDLTTQNSETAYAKYSYSSSPYDGLGESDTGVLKGYIGAYDDVRWQAGGFYRDQIYFTTANGDPADLAITLAVTASGETFGADPTSAPLNQATLTLGWNLYYGTGLQDYNVLGFAPLIDLIGGGQTGGYTDSLTLHSADSQWATDGNGYLIQSGTYVPYSVSVWGLVVNGELDWSNTVGFLEFTAFQEGRQLESDEFSVLRASAVPEPTTMLLLGLGLIGLAGVRRKLN